MTHFFRIWKERKWPNQWLGQCSCGKGIRCNHRVEAEAFFTREGCARGETE